MTTGSERRGATLGLVAAGLLAAALGLDTTRIGYVAFDIGGTLGGARTTPEAQ
ncbi:MAG TPA: hypothetical protein VIV59_00040 [Anaeromyxobacteraceae bacterium]